MDGSVQILQTDTKQKTLIVIAGPTAVGKTELAIQLARHYNTVIISADSRQFYREMAIGTAKPTPDELSRAKHYFINSHSVTDDFNVGDFETEGLKLLDQLFTEHNKVILAGGSGLYVKAICEGFDNVPSVDAAIRERLNAAYQAKGILPLAEQLKNTDPDYYNQVDLSNPQRIIRALEVIQATGKPFSSFRTAGTKNRPFNIIKIGLNLPREKLYERINQRVDLMIQQGLVAEVESLLPYRHYNALNTVGYKEIFQYLEGHIDLATAIASIKQNTRRFAKRQLTWFNKDKSTTWFEASNLGAIVNHISAQMPK